MSVLQLVAAEVRRAGRRAHVPLLLVPLAAALAMLTSGAMLLGGGRWLALPAVAPFAVWGGALLVVAGLGRLLFHRLRRRTDPYAVARAIEEEQRLRRGQLTGLLEVAHEGGVFVSQAADALGAKLAAVAEAPAPRLRKRITRAALLSAIAFGNIAALAGGTWTTRGDGWRALLSPVAAWRGTLLPALAVAEAPRRLPRGGAATIVLAAEGRRDVTLRWRLTGAGWRDTILAVGGDGRVAVTLGPIDADLALLATDGRAESDTALVRVVDRPFLGDVTIRATYPAYLGRPAERLDAELPLRLPAGTRLAFEGHSSESLAAVALVEEGRRIAFTVSGTSFTGGWSPVEGGTFTWEARGTAQAIEDLPPPLAVEVLADSLPRVEILEPTGELVVTAEDRVGIELLAQDDHALTGVWLRRRVLGADGSTLDSTVYQLSAEREAEWVGGALQEMKQLALEPGMRVEYVAVARDAAPGHAEARSAPLVLRMPSTDEERRAAREASERAVAAANAAAQAQAKLAEQTETASRSRSDRQATPPANAPRDSGGAPRAGGDRPMNFEGAEQAKAIAEQQRQLQDQVQKLEEAAREMEDRLRAAGALDTALARQLQDAQRMLREAMTPEMQESLRRLESSAQQLDGDRTRQSMRDLAQQQQRMREQLEKSAEMLKRAALEGAMQTLGDQARELARAQQQFADSARAGEPDPRQAQQLADRTRDVAQQMEQLQERLQRERAQTGAQQAGRAEEEARRAEAALQEAMRQAREAQRQPDGAGQQQAQQAARDAAEQAAQAMQQASQSMQRGRDGQVREWKGELTDAIDQSVQEMLQLAREQEQLAQRAQQDPNDPSLRQQQAALQQGMEAAQQRLSDEAKKSALVSPRTQQMMEQAEQRVQQATREAAQGQRGQASQSMQDAAQAMRQAAAQLTRDRERANDAQSASGLPEMMQQMQQLAQQQGALNGQMQSLFPQTQQRPSQSAIDAANRARARELARSQREVARALDDVADADPTGRAQEMAREARMLAQQLDQGVVDAATQARQERLFRRMLDAGRALEQEQKDESQRRESRAARGSQRFTPPDGPARDKAADRYAVPTWEELRGLSAEERRLVIEYFRRLNAEKSP
ncbi:MAG: hypothetical protein K1X31_06755 [Gemmatimonadaceae bacterium]|nr:hypothetical protein [Gemmatimonadaceae bacterium]